MMKIKQKVKPTTASLILDRSDGTSLSPINGIRQAIAGERSVAIALDFSQPLFGVDLSPQVHGPVLLVAQIGEPVQP